MVVGDAPLRVPQMVLLLKNGRAGRTGVRPLQNHRKLDRPIIGEGTISPSRAKCQYMLFFFNIGFCTRVTDKIYVKECLKAQHIVMICWAFMVFIKFSYF